jgi:hypothetical protein
VGALAATGSMPAVVRASDDFDVQSSRWVGAESFLLLSSRWVLRARATVGRDELPPAGATTFWTATLGLGARF